MKLISKLSLMGTMLLAAAAGAVTVHTAADGSTFDVSGG